MCFESSGDSTSTKSIPSFSISGMSSGRPTIPITLRSRDFAIVARHRATWEFAAFNTEASDGYVPLHAVLAHFLRERRAQTPYAAAEDFVFPSLRAEGRVPLNMRLRCKRLTATEANTGDQCICRCSGHFRSPRPENVLTNVLTWRSVRDYIQCPPHWSQSSVSDHQQSIRLRLHPCL